MPASYPSSLTIHELFEEQVRQHSNRTALVCGDSRFTYSELNSRANQLARRALSLSKVFLLMCGGVVPGSISGNGRRWRWPC